MAEKCINIKAVKTANKSMILKLLYCQGRMSRKEIARRTGLTPAAVTLQINELIEEGSVYEMYEQLSDRRAGRREIILDIARAVHVCIGVAISAYETKACLMDFHGKILQEREFSFVPGAGVEALVDAACEKIAGFQAYCEERHLKLVGVGVSLRGIVNGADGLWVDPYRLVPGRNIPLRDMFQARLQMPVSVEDGVRAMANAEMLLSGYTSSDGMLFVRYGPGVGGAVCIDNDMYCGAHFKAVEIGHVMMWDNTGGAVPSVRRRLEDMIAFPVITDEVKKQFSAGFCPKLFEMVDGQCDKVTIYTVFDAYSEHDPGVTSILTRCQENLIYGIYNAVCLFDPKKIVLYGEAFENERFYQNVMKMIWRCDMFPEYRDLIVKSAFNTTLSGRGPAALALRAFLECVDAPSGAQIEA